WRIQACIITVLLLLTATASAQSIDQLDAASFLKPNPDMTARFPTKLGNPLGWTMKVQVSPHSTADVMRIEIDLATTGAPTTADQTVTIRLTPISSGHAPPHSSTIVTVPVEIPQGTRKLRLARHAPKSSFGNLYQIQLYQDGRKLDDCQANVGEPIAYRDSALYFNQAAQNRMSVLWINHENDQASRSESLQ
ncbi:unnamed protein product, partial [Hapterophycus canaliculatus]